MWKRKLSSKLTKTYKL